MMNPRFVALCVLGSLTCVAYAGNVNGEAAYVSFSVPGALGTYPTGINASMAVTGYYDASSTRRGFLRRADGTITTFAVEGATSTVPEGINAAGNITGYYEKPFVYTELAFLRYADGRIITFDTDPTNGRSGFLPAGINDFNEIVGNRVYEGIAALIRSRAGVVSSLVLGVPGGAYPVATGLNASGSVIGYYGDAGVSVIRGFVAHPDGYWAEIQLPTDPGPDYCSNQIFPDAINAAGTIAGFFTKNYSFSSSCGANETGGFVLSPKGQLTLFEPPGMIPLFDDHDQDVFLMGPHWISIDQAGDIAGSYLLGWNYHGFVRNPYGTITVFDPPEGGETHVTGINDAGAIVGYYSYHSSGGSRPPVAFIRVPQ